jgi:PKD repeat protein
MSWTKSKLISILLLFLPVSLCFPQTDVEFWFAAPEVTASHCQAGTCPGGEPVFFRVSALNLPSTVRIYQPALWPAGLDTTFDVAANTTVSINATAWLNDLENTPPGITLSKGIHITSTNLITVYYDEDEYWNQDIFALKGRNALGREFYTPFNNIWPNGNYAPVIPYSSIDIVATQDNTQITITPTAACVGGHPAGIPFTITLNRGETFSCQATTQAAAGHLAGTHIVSNKPIAVTIKDDSVAANVCRDLIGDQTVPLRRADNTSVVGYEYIVMRGKINLINPNAVPPDPDGVQTGERIFIMATQPNTQVFIDGVLLTTLANPGQQVNYQLSKNATHVRGNKPIMILHVSGFGCESGGAVLPTIDGCTGSLEVSFTRSTNRDFYLNIMTIDAAKDAFTMHYEDGSTFDIPGGWFEDVGTTGYVTLSKDKKLFLNQRNGGVPQNEVTKVTNSVSVFHLGLIEGGTTTGCKYGYFSDYAESRGGVQWVETGSTAVFRCFGDTLQLRATGGLSYSWSPTDYLSDPFIATPVATPPPGQHQYTVTISRPCFGDTTITVIVGIAPEIEAFFDMDKWYICAPDTVTLDNRSFGVDMTSVSNVQWDFDLDDPFNPYIYDTNQVIQHFFTNNTNDTIRKTIQLVVWNFQSCASEFRRELLIRPEINAGFTTDVADGCHPVTVNFANTSTGNTDRYKWTLGDGNSSVDANPTHTYINYGMTDLNFHVQMVAISPFYCTDTVEADISVYPYLEAAFAIDTFQGCSPLMIGIDNNSAGYIEEYEWTFGDGTTSATSAASFSHIYTNNTSAPVTHNLRLVVKNNARGCTDTLTRIITVFPAVQALFTQDNAIGCHALDVNFTNQSSATAILFNWDFGDGGSSTLEHPSHQFENMTAANEDYTVRLISTTLNQCRDTSWQVIRVHPYINADFSVDNFQGCAPFLVTLQNSSEGAVSQYEWNWGDGSPPSNSSAATLTHLYQNGTAAPVTRPIRLVVRNADACTDTLTRNITVFPQVTSQFTQDVTAGCNPLQVQFTNQSNAAASIFSWEFGDGGSSALQNPAHTFQNLALVNTNFTTALISKSIFGCADTSDVTLTVYSYLRADFTLTQGSTCSPIDVTFTNSSVGGTSYFWTFGDGQDSSVLNKNPMVHWYNNPSSTDPATYEARLTVRNANNCVSELSRDVIIFPAVHANFTASAAEGCHPVTVNLTNQTTGAVAYNWTFDNGQSSFQDSPSVTLENFTLNDITFDIKLVASNINNCRDSLTVPILVHPYVEAGFAVRYVDQCAPATVIFNNSSVNGEDYSWSFGGVPYVTNSIVPITRQFTNASYSGSLNYTIDLLVTSPQGCISSISKQITVFHEVDAEFTVGTEGCQPLPVDFINSSQGGADYFWDFGDRGSSIVSDPSHTFTNLGDMDSVYNVTLLVASDDFCRDTAFTQVTVHPRPRALFTVDNSVDCPPLEVMIQNISEAGDSYTWDFGDGTPDEITTDLSNVAHTYYNNSDVAATYVLSLYAESAHGCTDEISQNMTAYPGIVADFERDSAGCSPYLSAFVNTSLRASDYQWDFGDGLYSTLTYPSHVFTNYGLTNAVFDVKLLAFSRFGCTDSITKQVTAFPSPIAEFNFSPVYQYYPEASVSLVNETNEGIWDFEWDFGDGMTSTLEDPGTYTYGHWGTYNIILNVSNDQCEHFVTHWIRIFPPMPVAEFEADVYAGCAPLTVSFQNNSLYGETYDWDFDDGETSGEFEPQHTYDEPGLYQVRLHVTGEGGEDYSYREVEPYRLPVVNFKVEPDSVMLPDEITKTFNFSEYGVRYLWDFGDGTESLEKEPIHQYTELGVYDVTLQVWTENECTASMTIPEAVTVIGKGMIRFPNAFAPNLDGPVEGRYDPTDKTNQVFFPLHDGVTEYELLIYSRWGELVFESHDVNYGWNGYHKDKLCAQGVYVWQVRGHYSTGRTFRLSGDVTLLHYPIPR